MNLRISSLAVASVMAMLLALPSSAQTLVKNPSFESNINTNSEPLSAGAPQGWPYYSSVDEWAGASGVNDLTYDAGGPFHNSGTPVPDGRRIGFKQGSGEVSQEILGLTPGKRHWIQFRYDTRNGSDLDFAVHFSTVNLGGAMDEDLDVIYNPRPAIGTQSPYYSRTVPFTPDVEGGTLSFVVTSRGDSTLLLDAITIVQRDEGNFPVMNPSFEASGVVFDGAPSAGLDWPAISGWANTGAVGVDDGTGGVADNGAIPEQALVAFIRGEGSLSQTLQPTLSGDNYQLQFAYNAQAGTTPHLQVLIDGAVVWEKDVTAVGGTAPYAKQQIDFKAASDTAVITFTNTSPGTVLLDDVRVAGKTGVRLPPLAMSPGRMLLRAGQEGTATIKVPDERLALGPAVVKLRSGDTGVFVLPDADSEGVLSLQFSNSSNASQTYRIRGVAVGNGSIEIVDPAGLPFPEPITQVFVAGSTYVQNPSFELDGDSGVGTAPITGWTSAGGNIGIAEFGNAFLGVEDLTAPDRRKVLRMQTGGTVSQEIAGLEPGQLYGLQFFYNGRTFGYPYEMAMEVSFAGQVLTNIPAVVPASQNGLTEYYFEELRFSPSAASGTLQFKVTVTSGDATLFLDAVSILPRIAGELAVMNSSFEGTAMGANWPGYIQNDRAAGWACAGGGYGVNAYSPKTFFVEPFLDNGINSDQDNAFFGQGAVTVKQVLQGLTAGQNYTLVFDYNFRDGRGQNSSITPNTGQVEVSFDGSVVFASDEVPPVDTISPWPGFRHTLPFYQAFVPFTAAADISELQIAHVGVAGDQTMLLDFVRVLPGSRTPFSITKGLEDQTVAAGDAVTLAVTASGNNLRYRWLLDGEALSDKAGVSGTSTATLTLSNVQPAQSGIYSVLITDGVGRAGSAASVIVEGSPVGDATIAAAFSGGKIVITWPASLTGYRLQRASSLPAAASAWTDEPTTPVANGQNLEVRLDPIGASGFYRLTQ
ncbi:MAG: hypothetical protein AB9869_19805 [Verrucomicrobiia bacterium]